MPAINPPMRPYNVLQTLSTKLAGATVTAGGMWEAAACGFWWAGTIPGMLGITIASAGDVGRRQPVEFGGQARSP